jgi:hypothetical protein
MYSLFRYLSLPHGGFMTFSTAQGSTFGSTLSRERLRNEEDFSEEFYTIEGTTVGVDPFAKKVYFNGDDQAFRASEVLVLDQLAKNFGKPISRESRTDV